MTAGQILGWIIAGLIVGLIARMLVPGRQSMGLILTIVLGILRLHRGGFIATQLFGPPPTEITVEGHQRGWLISILGGVQWCGSTR